MKAGTMIAIAVILAGVYIEYNKDSSFASIDTGSLLIAGGAGFLIGCYM